MRMGLGILVGSSCLVLGAWVSWWLVPVYVGLMIALLYDGGPAMNPQEGAQPIKETDEPAGPTAAASREEAATGRKRRRRKPRVDPGEVPADGTETAARTATTGSPRKGQARSRKKAALAEGTSLAAQPVIARWVQVAPGSFVRVEGAPDDDRPGLVETTDHGSTSWGAEPEPVASDPTTFAAPDDLAPSPDGEPGPAESRCVAEGEMRAERPEPSRHDVPPRDEDRTGPEAATIADDRPETTLATGGPPMVVTSPTGRAASSPLSSLIRVRVRPRSGRARAGFADARQPRDRGVRCVRRSRVAPSRDRQRRQRRAGGGRSRSREPPSGR
jgi:hypothetical protein